MASPSHADVKLVRLPLKPKLLQGGGSTISKGVALINADDWHDDGYTGLDRDGKPLKVGILDKGFLGYDAVGDNLPDPGLIETWWAPSIGYEGKSEHGTACAEIVYDIAYDAQFYLANFKNEEDFRNAVDWLISKQVNVISCSVGNAGWGPGDGSGTICDKVKEARDAGILWVQAAGNHAQKHWSGTYQDINNNGWHDFMIIPPDESNTIHMEAGDEVSVCLKWDDPWGASDNDYDLYLVDDWNTVVAFSYEPQDGDDDPIEILDFTAPESRDYHIGIKRWDARRDVFFHLFSFECDLEHHEASGSLLFPADSQHALTVGAIWASDPDTIVDYSSQGPTEDGRIKPDLVGPSWVKTSTDSNFYGTSAATPHAAGAALLVKNRFPDYTPDQIKAYLEGHAVELGDEGKDNQFGSGRLHLPVDPPSLTTYAAEYVEKSTAVLFGRIDGLGREADCDVRGFVWDDVGHSSDPGDVAPGSTAYGSNWTKTGRYEIGEYSHPVSGLSPGTVYYFRACAHNLSGWSYGGELQLHTEVKIGPTVTNHTGAQIITDTAAYLWGNITDTGGENPNVTIYWGESDGGTTQESWDHFIYLGPKPAGTFYTFVEGLAADTPYFYRCYATNLSGSDWADSTETFTIVTIRPTVTNAGGADPFTATTATLHGQLVDSGGQVSSQVNIYWGDEDAGVGPWDHCESIGTILTGTSFSTQVNGLAPNTQYYYRCYAQISGEGYDWADSSVGFTTNALTPGVNTQAADPVGDTAAGLHSSITDTGGQNCDQRGFVWDTSSQADPGSSTAPGNSAYSHYWTETGSFGAVPFSHWATQLSPGTRYFFRACAHNLAGWSYGPELGFTTKPGAPTNLNAIAVSTIQINLSWNPGVGAQKTMVRWSTTTYPSTPTDGNQACFDNSGNTWHTGLTPGIHYYYRAWSWVAGSDVWSDSSAIANATTQAAPGPTAPTVTTSPATGFTARSATLHGNLISLGTASSVQVSFEYKTTSETNWHQTTPASKTSTGAFDFSLNDLAPDMDYLYRARADGEGTGYGNTYSFSTLALTAPTVINNGAGSITSESALLRATLSDLGTASTVQVSFEYRTAAATAWQETTSISKTSTEAFDHALSGLNANTTYYFRAKAVGDETGYSGQEGFTTSTTPPAVTTQTPENVSSYSANLKGYLDSLGTSALVDVCFEWRKQGDTSYTETYPKQPPMSAPGEFTFHLSGLNYSTTYEFRAKAIGTGTGTGSVVTFETGSPSSHVDVPHDYTSIQAAINNAANGATIWVDARGPDNPYDENILVDKPVTILAPDGPAGTFVSGNETVRDYVFEVTANDVTIDGFTVKRGTSGIYLNGVTGCTISGNVFTDNYNGIELEDSDNNRLQGNTVTGLDKGIYLSNSDGNIISGNTAHGASFGIQLYLSNNNRLEGNTITDNTYDGIYALQSTGTEIVENDIHNNATSGDPYYGGVGLDSGATGTIVHNNNIYGNTASQEYHYGLFAHDPAVGDIDARYNYWGHASGPRHETASWRPDPGGDKVDANLAFRPWLIAEYDPASPPDIATDLHIVTGSLLPAAIEGQPYSVSLQASGGTGTYTWALYSGTLPDGLAFNQTTGEISGTPAAEGKYGFGVQVHDGIQGTHQDFNFLTGTNNPPHTPRSPSPLDQVTGIDNKASLSWIGGDPDPGNTVTYDVHFGTSQPPPLVSNDQATTTYNPRTMSHDTYYWQIAATDNYGASTAGPIWCFTTALSSPDPDPMTWATEPSGTNTSSIAMTATTATDPSTPVQYYFDFYSSPTGGSGGTDSGWQTSTSYTDTGLQANHRYGYRVKAKDSEGNETAYSSTAYAYTRANVPGTAGFTNVTQTSIRANWTTNGNPAGTEYYCENTTKGTNSGWTKNAYWTSTGLACGKSHSFRVRARNGDMTQTSPTTLGSQVTQSCSTNCPDCSGVSRNLENITFISGTVCECNCTTSLTIGAGVTVQAGATVIFRAPIVRMRPGFHAENGSKVYIVQR